MLSRSASFDGGHRCISQNKNRELNSLGNITTILHMSTLESSICIVRDFSIIHFASRFMMEAVDNKFSPCEETLPVDYVGRTTACWHDYILKMKGRSIRIHSSAILKEYKR